MTETAATPLKPIRDARGPQRDDAVRFVTAYLDAAPRDPGPTWEDALEAFAALIERWRDADIDAQTQAPLLLEAAAAVAHERGLAVGELLGAVAQRIAHAGGDARPAGSANHARILAAAYRCFAERGFYDTTVDAIAEAAGVGKGTVYRHFESKENLFRAVVEDRLQELIARIRAAFLGADDVLGAIRRAVGHYLGFFEEHKEFYRILVYEQQGFGQEFRARYLDGILENVPAILEKVVGASGRGVLKPLDDFYTIFYGLVGFMDGVIQKWLRNGCPGPLTDELDTVVEVLFYGFVQGPPSVGRDTSGR